MMFSSLNKQFSIIIIKIIRYKIVNILNKNKGDILYDNINIDMMRLKIISGSRYDFFFFRYSDVRYRYKTDIR